MSTGGVLNLGQIYPATSPARRNEKYSGQRRGGDYLEEGEGPDSHFFTGGDVVEMSSIIGGSGERAGRSINGDKQGEWRVATKVPHSSERL